MNVLQHHALGDLASVIMLTAYFKMLFGLIFILVELHICQPVLPMNSENDSCILPCSHGSQMSVYHIRLPYSITMITMAS